MSEPKSDGRQDDRAANGPYHLKNVQTGDYATLFSDADRCEMVNTNDNTHPGSQVKNFPFHSSSTFTSFDAKKWIITHLKRDEYKIRNSTFASFACFDNRPEVGDRILGKWDQPSTWRVRPTPGPKVCFT